MLLVGAVALVVALAITRGGPDGSAARASTAPGVGVGAPAASVGLGLAASLRPSASTLVGGRALPPGLVDRGWVAEVAVQRWIAGTLSGRILVLPADEVGLWANATSVVSVRYGSKGATSTVRVRDFGALRTHLSVDRPGTVTSAVIVGNMLYVAGDDGSGSSDAGVQAISLDDGSVTDLISPGAAPADMTAPVTRGQLRLSPSGRTLGSPFCGGDRCSIDLVSLAGGQRRTVAGGPTGFLLGLTDDALFVADEPATGIRAIDVVTGLVRWTLPDAQIGGVLASADGSRVVIGYMPDQGTGGPPTFTLASADTATGSLRVLLQRAADTDPVSFFPDLSSDRFAVIASGGSLSDVLGGIRHRIALTLVDAATGRAQADAVTLTAP
jgi:hypothetical protein